MKILTHISTFSVKEPVTKDILVATRTSYNQILVSKYSISLKGIGTPWRNNRFQKVMKCSRMMICKKVSKNHTEGAPTCQQ